MKSANVVLGFGPVSQLLSMMTMCWWRRVGLPDQIQIQTRSSNLHTESGSSSLLAFIND
jgi:hypothetical protein